MSRWAATALVAAAALAAGCGTSAEEEFRTTRLDPLEDRIDRHRAEIGAVLRTTQARDAADLARLKGRIGALEREVAKAAAVDAPESVAGDYARHVRALEVLVRDLRGLASALRAGPGATLRQAGERAAGAADSVVRTRQALDDEIARRD